MRSKLLIALLGLLVLGIGAAGALTIIYRTQVEGASGGRPVTLVVTPGSSAVKIAESLERRGVISSSFWFLGYLKIQGAGRNLRAGEYRLRTRMPFDQLLTSLEKGPAIPFRRLTLPEGLTVEQVAGVVEASTHIPADQFLPAATPLTVRPSILPDGAQSLEGFLYPTTYHVIERETPQDLVRRLVAQFEKEVREAPWDKATSLGRTPYEILVIASMIEEEAKADEERFLISAVIHNRLRRGMLLGIDATIQYAVKKYSGEPLTESDLAVDSSYNTRRYPGLPPTPISSPRVGSIVAALQPASSEALFYVLTGDCKHHFFTADSRAFERAKQAQPRSC